MRNWTHAMYAYRYVDIDVISTFSSMLGVPAAVLPGKNKLFLNIMIPFYLNSVTNLYQLTSHSTTSCPTTWRSYRDHRLLWLYCDVTSAHLYTNASNTQPCKTKTTVARDQSRWQANRGDARAKNVYPRHSIFHPIDTTCRPCTRAYRAKTIKITRSVILISVYAIRSSCR